MAAAEALGGRTDALLATHIPEEVLRSFKVKLHALAGFECIWSSRGTKSRDQVRVLPRLRRTCGLREGLSGWEALSERASNNFRRFLTDPASTHLRPSTALRITHHAPRTPQSRLFVWAFRTAHCASLLRAERPVGGDAAQAAVWHPTLEMGLLQKNTSRVCVGHYPNQSFKAVVAAARPKRTGCTLQVRHARGGEPGPNNCFYSDAKVANL